VVTATDDNGASDTQNVTITITGTNDAPDNTVPGAQTVAEDTALSLTGLSVNDVDGNLATTKLTVTNGDLTVSLAGGATISAGANASSTLTLSGTQAQINAALATLSYQGDANFNGADTLTVLSTDSAGTPLSDTDTVGITVTAVTTPPSDSSDDDFVYDEVTNADDIPEVVGSQGNSPVTNNPLAAVGAVVDAVSAANGLGSLTSLGADGAVLDAVEGANSQRIYFGDNFDSELADGIGLWDVSGVKGFTVSFSLTELSPGSETDLSLFPLRVGGLEAEAKDQLIVKSILRDRTLFLEVDYTVNSDPDLSATRISVIQVNGSPLPEWLRMDDKGRLVSGEPPVGTENIELRIEVTLSDDTKIIRYVDVNVNSGEIASLEQIGEELIASASLFENQIEKEAIKFENASKDIEKSFIN
jgi:hypothetical protein